MPVAKKIFKPPLPDTQYELTQQKLTRETKTSSTTVTSFLMTYYLMHCDKITIQYLNEIETTQELLIHLNVLNVKY